MFQMKVFMHILYSLIYLSMDPTFMLFAIPRLTQQSKHVFSISQEADGDGGGDGAPAVKHDGKGGGLRSGEILYSGHQFGCCSECKVPSACSLQSPY